MNEQFIYNRLRAAGLTNAGAAGLMGNMFYESGLDSTNVQNTANKRLGMSDVEYTAAVDSGAYGNFANDSAGYGLVQHTSSGRKQNLLNFAKMRGASIGDVNTQVDFIVYELQGNAGLWNTLTTTQDVHQASNAVLTQYERPKDQSQSVKNLRASKGNEFSNLAVGYAPGAEVDASMAGLFNQVTPEVPTWSQNAGIDMSAYSVDMTPYMPQQDTQAQLDAILQQQQAEAAQAQMDLLAKQQAEAAQAAQDQMNALLQQQQEIMQASVQVPDTSVVPVSDTTQPDLSSIFATANLPTSVAEQSVIPEQPVVSMAEIPVSEQPKQEWEIIAEQNHNMLMDAIQEQQAAQAQAEATIEAFNSGAMTQSFLEAYQNPEISPMPVSIQEVVMEEQPVVDDVTQHQMDMLAGQLPDFVVPEEPAVSVTDGMDIPE